MVLSYPLLNLVLQPDAPEGKVTLHGPRTTVSYRAMRTIDSGVDLAELVPAPSIATDLGQPLGVAVHTASAAATVWRNCVTAGCHHVACPLRKLSHPVDSPAAPGGTAFALSDSLARPPYSSRRRFANGEKECGDQVAISAVDRDGVAVNRGNLHGR
jgi:hypothetical protein